MTQEEQFALIGRVVVESKAAEEELNQLLVKMDQHAGDMTKLAGELTKRTERAKDAGQHVPIDVRMPGIPRDYTVVDHGLKDARRYAKSLDLDAIERLDGEITEAVKRAIKLREQRLQLGV